VVLKCDETEDATEIAIDVIEKKIEFNIIDTARIAADKLRVSYSIKEISNLNQDVKVEYILFNENKEKVVDYTQNELLNPLQEKNSEVIIPINESLEGNFELLININSEKYSAFIQEDIILAPLSGFTIFSSEDNALGLSNGFIVAVLIALFLIALIIIRIIKVRREYGYIKKAENIKPKKWT